MKILLPRTRLIPLIVACALFMENLDSTVLSTSLPAIAVSLGENPLRLNLAITSYLFSLAVFIPVSGWFADRFGARTVLRAAIGVFVLGSILCGLADSLAGFVIARMIQGLGGAMMTPVGRLVVVRGTPKAQLVSALATLSIPALIGPVLGPPLGGFITTYASWRWIFWLNVPIGILGIVLVSIFIDNAREERTPPFDGPGMILTAIGLTGIVFGFECIGRDLVPPVVVGALLAVGAVALSLYVRHARRVPYPVIDLSLLRIPAFRHSILGGFLFRVGIGALPFLLPMMLQIGFGLNPLQSGLITFAAAIGALSMKATAGPIIRRIGFRRVLVGNALLSGAFIAVCGLFQPDTPHWLILALLLSGGFFRSLQFTSINALAFADVPRDQMSRATSFVSMAQQLSLSVGVGTGALVLHLTVASRGDVSAVAGDFALPFFVVGGISALSVLVFLRLRADAGAEVAGRSVERRAQPPLGTT